MYIQNIYTHNFGHHCLPIMGTEPLIKHGSHETTGTGRIICVCCVWSQLLTLAVKTKTTPDVTSTKKAHKKHKNYKQINTHKNQNKKTQSAVRCLWKKPHPLFN